MVSAGTPGGPVAAACGCPLGTDASAGLGVTWKAEQRAWPAGEWGHSKGIHKALELLKQSPRAEPCAIPFPAVPGSVELSPSLPAPSKPFERDTFWGRTRSSLDLPKETAWSSASSHPQVSFRF